MLQHLFGGVLVPKPPPKKMEDVLPCLDERPLHGRVGCLCGKVIGIAAGRCLA